VVITLYNNPYDVNFPDGFDCGDLKSIGGTVVNVIDGSLYAKAQASGIMTADLRGPFTSHGAGASNNWTFGTHCDDDSILWSWRLGWSPQCSNACQQEDESKFDPHPNNAGTCAIAQAIATRLGDPQPNCSTTNPGFGPAPAAASRPSPQTVASSNPTTLSELAAACAQNKDLHGFGSAMVSGKFLASHETVSISEPCVITLANGATVRLENSGLTAHNLIIRDDEGLPNGVSLELENSTLNGNGDAGLFVRLRNPGDRIKVNHSTLDFNLSVWLGAGSGGVAQASGGVIEINNSTIRSVGSDTQGIQALASAASGSARFNNDRFETSYLDGVALLFAHSCRQNQVTGSIHTCAPVRTGPV